MKANSSENVADPVELTRKRLSAAENSVQTAKHEHGAAKRKRNEAKEAARRTKKRLKRAKRELAEARRALAEAEEMQAGKVRAAVKAAKRAKPRVTKVVPLKAARRRKAKEAKFSDVAPSSTQAKVAGDFQLPVSNDSEP